MERIGTGKLRQQNDQLILSYLLNGKTVTKRELSDETGLTFMTVGNILNEFKFNNIVIEKEVIQLKKGRPTITYQLNPDYFHSLCLFIIRKNNKNFIQYQINNSLKEIIKEHKEEINEITENSILEYIKNIIHYDFNIKVIGIGTPSIISNGVILESDIHELTGMNIEKFINDHIGIKTYVKNDMNYCAYGYYERLEDKYDLCYLTFPSLSGPGCGTIINGHLLEGRNTIAGEILYLPFFGYKKNKNKCIDYNEHNIALCISCLSSIINPSSIILSGEEMKNINIEDIKYECLEYIPKDFMPSIIYKEDYEKDYFLGIKKYIHEQFLKTG